MGQLCGTKSVGLCVASSPQSVTFISMGSSTFATVGYFEYHCCTGGCLPVKGALREMFFVVVYLTLTCPLGIQPWSQDRRNQTKSNGEQFQRKQSTESDRRNVQESSQQRTSSSGRDTEETKKKVKVRVCASPEAQRMPYVPRWAAVPLLLLIFCNIIVAPMENIQLSTAYTSSRRFYTVVQAVHNNS